MNRLTCSTVAGRAPVNIVYHDNGNIQSSTLAGSYTYNVPNKPYAVGEVEGFDVPPIVGGVKGYEAITTYTTDNRIATIDNGRFRNEFTYGPSGMRFKVDHFENSTKTKTKIYVDNSEYALDAAGNVVTARTIIYAPTGACAVYQDSASVKTFSYIHTDYLGSWLAITGSTGSLKKRYSYDAWGRPRNPSTWLNLTVNANDATGSLNAMQPMFDRGYTGHEHMAGFGLINMNGRVYDPYLQRFLSPDPFIQAPGNAQNYNRYSYVLNNPLMHTDPSGYLTRKELYSIIQYLLYQTPYGGSWSESTGVQVYGSEREAKHEGFAYKRMFGGGSSSPGSRPNSTEVLGARIRVNGVFGRIMQWLGLGIFTKNQINLSSGLFQFIYSTSDFSGISYEGGDQDLQGEVGNPYSLLFDGKRLMVVNENTGNVDYSTLATSGKGEHMNNPKSQHLQDVGPIPQGVYSISNSQWSHLNLFQQYKRLIRGGDWGKSNVPLTPITYQGKRGQDGRFFLHGGLYPGSAGCIDAGLNINKIFYYISNQDITYLRVRY